MAVREATHEELKELYREEVCKRQDLEKERDTLQNELRRTEDGRKCMSIARDAALAERDKALQETKALSARNAELEEEQREAKKRAASLAADMALAREEVARLVRLNDDFKERLQKVTTEKNQILEISNGFARERDEIRAGYDARGKVIKKLRKRLHKLKKKLKH